MVTLSVTGYGGGNGNPSGKGIGDGNGCGSARLLGDGLGWVCPSSSFAGLIGWLVRGLVGGIGSLLV